jgi:hypothetical protein
MAAALAAGVRAWGNVVFDPLFGGPDVLERRVATALQHVSGGRWDLFLSMVQADLKLRCDLRQRPEPTHERQPRVVHGNVEYVERKNQVNNYGQWAGNVDSPDSEAHIETQQGDAGRQQAH